MVTLEKVTLPYSARSAPGGLILSRKSRQTRCYSPFNVVFKLTRISKNLLKLTLSMMIFLVFDGIASQKNRFFKNLTYMFMLKVDTRLNALD